MSSLEGAVRVDVNRTQMSFGVTRSISTLWLDGTLRAQEPERKSSQKIQLPQSFLNLRPRTD